MCEATYADIQSKRAKGAHPQFHVSHSTLHTLHQAIAGSENMEIKITVTDVNINVPRHVSALRSKELWTFIGSEWHRLYREFCPFKEGILYNQVRIEGGDCEAVIEHTAPYAHYMYEGRVYGPNVPISQGGCIVGYFSPKAPKHPTGAMITYRGKGSRYWDKAAEPTKKPLLIRSIQNYINSGRLFRP